MMTLKTKMFTAEPLKDKGTSIFWLLLRLMWNGDCDVLRGHLEEHKVDDLAEEGAMPLLHMACSAEIEPMTGISDKLVKQLLQAGADVNFATPEAAGGYFPLMQCNSAEIVNCLLDNGADIDQKSSDGSTALLWLSASGRLAAVEALLKRGAQHQITQRCSTGCTALSAAVYGNHEDVTMALLQELLQRPGFDISHPRLAANQPLLCAAATVGMLRVVEVCLNHGAAVNACGPDGTALMRAARAGHLEIVTLLCERGADARMRHGGADMGIDSLFHAVVGGHLEVAKVLIQHGADVNDAADAQQPSLIAMAAMSGEREILAALLDDGATLDPVKQYHCLSFAAHILDDDAAAAEVVKLLLPHCSTSLEFVGDSRRTALTYALTVGKLQTAQVLHAAGGNVNQADCCGTAMHCAAESGLVATFEWLQSLGLDPRAVSGCRQLLPLHIACAFSHYDLVKYLLDLPGAAGDVHACTAEGLTPLHLVATAEKQPMREAASSQFVARQTAAKARAERIVELLLQRGAVADAHADNCTVVGSTAISGVTPLMLATTAPVTKLLLAAGADATAVDSAGMLVLHYSAKHGAAAGAVCLLLKAGADPTATDADGSTAAHIAGMNGHFALEALLSRAADDYRKACAAQSAAGSASNSSISSSSGRSSADAATLSNDTSSSNDSSTTAAASARAIKTAAVSGTAAPAVSSSEKSSSSNNVQQQQQQQKQQQTELRRAKQPCANCKKPTTKLCRRCAAVYYCSVAGQRMCFKDPAHRAQCEAKANEIM
jgi:ankyrin repeat protein